MPETEKEAAETITTNGLDRYLRELIKNGNLPKNTEKIQFSFFLSPVLLFPIWIVAIIHGGGHSEVY